MYARGLWNTTIQTPKTQAAIRDVDVTSELADMLRAFVGNRSGLLFVNERGRVLAQSNLLQRSLHPLLEKLNVAQTGFHSFRRFRTTQLGKQRVPEDLLRFWIGHGPKTITDIYSQLKEDAAFK
jgi:hypothetical protein